MRPATEADWPGIEAFLQARVERSMFPLLNLRDHGFESDAPYAMRFWIAGEGAISDVLGLSRAGMVMPQCPNGPWDAVADVLRGQRLDGVIGPAEQARPLMAAAGLVGQPATLDQDEPLMQLDLAELKVPEGPGEIVPLAEADRATILDWMTTYEREALRTPEADARAEAEEGYAYYCKRGSHVALVADGVPLAMTGFNAALPDIVQIGGVFTPEPLRSRGHARRALALHLQEARARGVGKSVLFSASEAARRSYAGIGYEQVGEWTLCLFDPPAVGA